MKKTYNTICIGGVKINIGIDAISDIKKDIQTHHLKNALIVTDKGILSHGLLNFLLPHLFDTGININSYDDTLPNPPLSQINEVLQVIRESNIDCLIAMGGGSVMDLAKVAAALATNPGEFCEYIHTAENPRELLHSPLPLYCIPTTSGTGSEVTQYAVITDEVSKQKITIGNPKLVSKSVFLDPRLTLSLPPSITASTAIDALAHALEAFTSSRIINAPGSSIISDTLALKALDLITNNLSKAYHNGDNLEARSALMLGSTMAGLITQAGSGAAHGLSHALTSHFGIPHGDAIGALLKSVMTYNLPACESRYSIIAQNCSIIRKIYGSNANAENFIQFITDLLDEIGIKPLHSYISDLSMLDGIIEEATYDKCTTINAIPLSADDVHKIYIESY